MQIDGACHCALVSFTAEVDAGASRSATAQIARFCPVRRSRLSSARRLNPSSSEARRKGSSKRGEIECASSGVLRGK